ncbi:nucleolar complex protein 4 homolog B isoform X1 [Pseudomyrmex gracilis]|uniref:nucleolar complex protein 4 homolog B isoform X1 n=1 Tax=Pseudomyrmex gracilis TaxID=219809 RepID=UPI00099508E6|nr:nucleolar complex protein 4 homolog B isoform X1 [Pseudomyrmex gracilis]XP_020282506.1 nucleolar complex protein 4 homolog B isoform X1 [Pseudomyrmex gracilis]
MTDASDLPGASTSQRTMSKLLRQWAQEFLTLRKHANNLIDIISHWDDCTITCLLTLETIFTEVLKRGDMYLERTIALTISEPSAEFRYITWLRNCYEEVWKKVLLSMESSRLTIQLQVLTTAIKLMAEEGRTPLEPCDNPGYHFPLHRLRPILMTLLSPEKDNTNLISRFQEIAGYPDALYYTWKCLPSLTPKRQPQEIYIKNLLELIDKIPVPKEEGSKLSDNKELLCGSQQGATFTWDQFAVKRALNKVWACVMHWELTPQLHKQLLIVLLERIMSHLDKPLLLTDFLMDSLDAEGSISVLALQGVFILVTKHNLEYPNIFTKLYSMFEPEIFHTKYKARLFYLSDLFLSSTHLPETLVAAFAKRLARLTLVAPPEDILIILLFVGNLLLRHPGLKRLIDHPQGGEVTSYATMGAGDPFLMEERDPLLSNAMLSSLWEIRALQQHILPSVASAAQFIREPLPSVEYDMASALERNSGYIFDRELKSKVKDIMLTFERPTSMALLKGEKLLQYWQLTSTY